jgi:hypothetical protein
VASVSATRVVLAAVACLALVALSAWYFERSLTEVSLLAPIVVVCFGAVAGLVVLWSRIVLDALRRRNTSDTQS